MPVDRFMYDLVNDKEFDKMMRNESSREMLNTREKAPSEHASTGLCGQTHEVRNAQLVRR